MDANEREYGVTPTGFASPDKKPKKQPEEWVPVRSGSKAHSRAFAVNKKQWSGDPALALSIRGLKLWSGCRVLGV